MEKQGTNLGSDYQGYSSAKYDQANEKWKRGMQNAGDQDNAQQAEVRIPEGKTAFIYKGCTVFCEPGAHIMNAAQSSINGMPGYVPVQPENCDFIGYPNQAFLICKGAYAFIA